MFALSLIEVVLYLNHKAHIKLFLAMKVAEKHQKQMLDLLDSVPDKVLICKEPQEGLNPKCIYSNRKMNDFFGRDLVQAQKQTVKKKSNKIKSLRIKEKGPM